jgi:hypothetical protein
MSTTIRPGPILSYYTPFHNFKHLSSIRSKQIIKINYGLQVQLA